MKVVQTQKAVLENRANLILFQCLVAQPHDVSNGPSSTILHANPKVLIVKQAAVTFDNIGTVTLLHN